MSRMRLLLLPGLYLALAGLAGCSRSPAPTAAPKAPVIPVSHPVEGMVTDYVEFTGRTAAKLSTDVRPRVTGYLVQMPFREGAPVHKGDLLFEIDPAPYQAQFDAAHAQVGIAEAALRLARVTLQRNQLISQRDPGAVSQQELDQYRAQADQAAANLKLAQANLATAKLKLDWTKVTSPIDGQVSRYYLTLGNLVTQDQTLLTTVMSLDPMYVYFDVDERTVLRVRKGVNAGLIKVPEDRTNIPVEMGLEGEEGFPHRGTLDFINNALTPSTGTILVRAIFDNPQPQVEGPEPRRGRRLLSPGMFVRVRLPIGEPHPALLVIDRAVGSDQGLKFLYVLDRDNKVQYRRVSTGALQDNGLRVIEGAGDRGIQAADTWSAALQTQLGPAVAPGPAPYLLGVAELVATTLDLALYPDDWVIVGGLQQLRPRMEIDPDRIAMPTLIGVAGGEPLPAGENKR
jgi:multidrug efflux system membrane fusion protein